MVQTASRMTLSITLRRMTLSITLSRMTLSMRTLSKMTARMIKAPRMIDTNFVKDTDHGKDQSF